MLYNLSPGFFLAILIIGIFVTEFVGFRIGRRIGPPKEGAPTAAFNTALAAIFAVVALVLSFTFSFTLTRYEWRRQLVVQEANDIGTLSLRASVLDRLGGDALRGLLRTYAQARIDYYRDESDASAQDRDQAASERLQDRMWRIASDAVRANPRSLGPSLVMQVTNSVIDTSAEQSSLLKDHLGGPALLLVFSAVIAGALMIGLGFGRTNTPDIVVSIIFGLLLASLVNTIIELDSPQSGKLRTNLAPLYKLQQSTPLSTIPKGAPQLTLDSENVDRPLG
jgi:hypothetical protein